MISTDLIEFSVPAIFSPSILRHFFNDSNELFKREEVGVPYDIVAQLDENDEVESR